VAKALPAPALPAIPVPEWTPARIRDSLDKAMTGDKVAFAAVRTMLDQCPEMLDSFSTLGGSVEDRYLAVFTNEQDLLTREVFRRRLAAMRAELAGEQPTPLERLLTERIVACWLQVMHADSCMAKAESQSVTLTMGEYHRQRQNQAHKRYLSAIRTLAQVRRLQLPAMQINVADQQVNISGEQGQPARAVMAGPPVSENRVKP
jgi:hypothetical protein